MAPGKTPDDVVATLNRALRKVQAKPELVKKLEDAGYTVMSGTPADRAAPSRRPRCVRQGGPGRRHSQAMTPMRINTDKTEAA